MSGVHRIELNQEVDSSLQNVTCSLSNVSRRLPFAETLQFPLDIPPNQSLSRWLAIAVTYQGIASVSGTPIHIQATAPIGEYKWSSWKDNKRHSRGVKKRVLAKTDILVFPAKQESRTIDIYNELQLPIP
jgi:hypothetical protein